MKRICVIGAGNWGQNHIRVLNKMGALSGVCDSNSEAIENLKKTQMIDTNYFTKVTSALEFGFDAFVVATPPRTHYNIARKIIKSGAHLLIEKPITIDLNEAIELNDLSKKHNVNLMVGHILLFHPAFLKIKEIIDQGRIGDLQYIYSNRLNHGVIRTQENSLWSLAPHDISLFQYLVGCEPLDVKCNGVDIVQPGIHDSTITILNYPNKIMCHSFVSWLHPFKEHRFIVIGSRGMIHFEDSIESKPLLFYNKNIAWENNIPIANTESSEKIEFESLQPLSCELEYFINHLDGTPINRGCGDSAIEVMKILTQATKELKRQENEIFHT